MRTPPPSFPPPTPAAPDAADLDATAVLARCAEHLGTIVELLGATNDLLARIVGEPEPDGPVGEEILDESDPDLWDGPEVAPDWEAWTEALALDAPSA